MNDEERELLGAVGTGARSRGLCIVCPMPQQGKEGAGEGGGRVKRLCVCQQDGSFDR